MPPLPRTSASSSEPRSSSRQRGRRVLPSDDAGDVVARARTPGSPRRTLCPLSVTGRPPSCSASSRARRMSSRSSALRRWSRGVSTCTANHSAWTRAAIRRVARTSRAALGAGPDAHQQPLARRPRSRGCPARPCSRASARPPARRCAGAPARAARSGCPCGRSARSRGPPARARRPCPRAAAAAGRRA